VQLFETDSQFRQYSANTEQFVQNE